MNWRSFWAKSPLDGEPNGESLLDHILSTWTSFLAFRRKLAFLPALCESPSLWATVGYSVIGHDLGKGCCGFQDMLRGRGDFLHRHEVLSLLFLPWLIGEEDRYVVAKVAAAIVTHHRELSLIEERYQKADRFLDLPDELSQIENQLTAEFFGEVQSMIREGLWPVLQKFDLFPSGLNRRIEAVYSPPDPIQMIRQVLDLAIGHRDRLRTLSIGHREVLEARFLRGLLMMSDHASSAHLNVVSSDSFSSSEDFLLKLDISEEQLYPHQRDCAQRQGSAVLIAPTSSGKTEASLLWTFRQRSRGQRNLFYVLPFQASLNAMFGRFSKLFDERSISLYHANALQTLYRNLLARNGSLSPSDAAQLAKEKQDIARLLLTQIRLTTPYQLLKASFQLRGHESLWTDAAGSTMIWDEIHAYEPKRLGMILGMVRHLVCELGTHVFFMSATMPTKMVRLLAELLPATEIIRATGETFDKFRRHRAHLIDSALDDPTVLEAIVRQVTAGKAVLVVANTVEKALRIRDTLRANLPVAVPVQVLHSRFNAVDRNEKERALLQVRGVGIGQATGAMVLVATQVVEVSLNVDFEVLYTDPAPLEALLQRFGRVNRGHRLDGTLKDVFVCTAICAGTKSIYGGHWVEDALEQLANADGQAIDEGRIQEMLDTIYGSGPGEAWVDEVLTALRVFERDILAQCYPFDSGQFKDDFAKMFDGEEVLPEGLVDRYRALYRDEPLLAPSYMVPIRYFQFRRLQACGAIEEIAIPGHSATVNVVHREYSSERGLQI